ncbi:uncharacterized protein LOC116202928 [Punica granatum]|uniref:Uncharacterized protein n=2 Tax=Punica granatum TaxID=22663 RepID=A0A2I0KN67_PUNGR|nr:uncharacterized protein LOC116202928 [Punica granatum]PKI69935.1 hypothetical protein CRG98_009810 [Punica granatum]
MEGEDERREAAIASAPALQPNSKPSGVTKGQLSKFQELHRRRLQIKAKSKKQKGLKGVTSKFQWKYDNDKDCLGDDSGPQGSSVPDSGSPTEQENVATDVGLKTRQKLHWGLDVKERWERKANM